MVRSLRIEYEKVSGPDTRQCNKYAGSKGGSAGIMIHVEGSGDYTKANSSTALASSLIASNNISLKKGVRSRHRTPKYF